MAAQDELYRAFLDASGQSTPDFAPIQYALADLIGQIDQAQRVATQQSAAAQTAAKKGTAQGATQSSSSSDSTFEKVLKSGFGVSPIVSGLIGLFTGSDTPAPLTKFALPPSI